MCKDYAGPLHAKLRQNHCVQIYRFKHSDSSAASFKLCKDYARPFRENLPLNHCVKIDSVKNLSFLLRAATCAMTTQDHSMKNDVRTIASAYRVINRLITLYLWWSCFSETEQGQKRRVIESITLHIYLPLVLSADIRGQSTFCLRGQSASIATKLHKASADIPLACRCRGHPRTTARS